MAWLQHWQRPPPCPPPPPAGRARGPGGHRGSGVAPAGAGGCAHGGGGDGGRGGGAAGRGGAVAGGECPRGRGAPRAARNAPRKQLQPTQSLLLSSPSLAHPLVHSSAASRAQCHVLLLLRPGPLPPARRSEATWRRRGSSSRTRCCRWCAASWARCLAGAARRARPWTQVGGGGVGEGVRVGTAHQLVAKAEAASNQPPSRPLPPAQTRTRPPPCRTSCWPRCAPLCGATTCSARRWAGPPSWLAAGRPAPALLETAPRPVLILLFLSGTVMLHAKHNQPRLRPLTRFLFVFSGWPCPNQPLAFLCPRPAGGGAHQWRGACRGGRARSTARGSGGPAAPVMAGIGRVGCNGCALVAEGFIACETCKISVMRCPAFEL